MARVLVTGISGTGKSTALIELARRGFRVVDTDYDDWSEWVPPVDDAPGEWLWREERIAELLAAEDEPSLYVQGCVSNQGKFYDRFDAIVLLSAPADVIRDRVASRTTNDYGKGARGARPHPVPPRVGGAAAAGDVYLRDRREEAARRGRPRADRNWSRRRLVMSQPKSAGGREPSDPGACYGETPWPDSCSSRAASSRRSARASWPPRSGAC